MKRRNFFAGLFGSLLAIATGKSSAKVHKDDFAARRDFYLHGVKRGWIKTTNYTHVIEQQRALVQESWLTPEQRAEARRTLDAMLSRAPWPEFGSDELVAQLHFKVGRRWQ